MVCEESHGVSRDTFLLPSNVRAMCHKNYKKISFQPKGGSFWFVQFVMDVQSSLPMGYVDARNVHGFSRRLDSWTRDLLWATKETNPVKLRKYSELEIVGGCDKIMRQVN